MKILSLSLLCLLFLPVLVNAAWVDPGLNQSMNSEQNDFIPALIFLQDQVDLDSLVSALQREHASLERRHYVVIEALKDKAAETQDSILSMTRNAAAAGEVRDVKTFWIVNMIAVEAKPAFLAGLVNDPRVRSLYRNESIALIEPVDKRPNTSLSKAVENGIGLTRAPELWAMGIKGQTALACDQDTGADGTHPAFADRWRGLDSGVDPGAAWFEPVHGETFPTDFWDHGTHTLGTMVGDDGAGHQIGMAPEAKWIGAKTIDTDGDIFTDAVAAFQWAADPDDNPSTMDDVPDVINNSWGLSQGWYGSCQDDFNLAIDAAEAAGVAVVFSAGNDGPGAATMGSPGNRIKNSINVFSVGALEQDGETIADFSSRGPSDCDGATIKPEVVAVGVDVNSAMPGGGYQTMSGTSMSGPHVSGAILLLRDAYPDAPPEDLKWALYFTAVDMGAVGEDNTYGRGLIDVVAAYNYLGSVTDCDKDGDSYDAESCGGNDCDDYDPDMNTGMDELCGDNKDNDCNGLTDAEDPGVVPTTPEICGDGRDNDCNADIDYDDADCLHGGPDDYGYIWDYTEPYSWTDVSDGTLGPQADEELSGPAQLGFTFNYYGQNYTSVYVGTNGYLTFANEGSDYNVVCSEGAMSIHSFAGFWLDLVSSSIGSVYYKTVGVSPTRKFIAQWDGVPKWGDATNTGTFQVVLEEATQDIVVYIQNSYDLAESSILLRGNHSGHYLAAHCGEYPPKDAAALRFVNPINQNCDGCMISGVCCEDQEANPNNPCQICDADLADTQWSPNDGFMCDDGEFCNGLDACLAGQCDVHAGDPCPDDGLYCTGVESCNEDEDSCEAVDAPECLDDGLFCDGVESCDEETDQCVSSGDPCEENQSCDENAGECVIVVPDDDTADDDTSAADDDTDEDDDDEQADTGDDDNDTGGSCGC